MKKIIILISIIAVLAGCVTNAPPAQEPPALTALSPERDLQIRENFLLWLHDASYLTVDETRVEQYYGTFNGREVIRMWIYGAVFSDVMVSEVIAAYNFEFPNSGWRFEHSENYSEIVSVVDGVHIWLHDNGDFMCICVGYERGYLTAEDIGVIWARHQG